MVSKKLAHEKQHQKTFRKTKQNKSVTKIPNGGKNEDKMIENLRGIQETLKNKL